MVELLARRRPVEHRNIAMHDLPHQSFISSVISNFWMMTSPLVIVLAAFWSVVRYRPAIVNVSPDSSLLG